MTNEYLCLDKGLHVESSSILPAGWFDVISSNFLQDKMNNKLVLVTVLSYIFNHSVLQSYSWALRGIMWMMSLESILMKNKDKKRNIQLQYVVELKQLKQHGT